MPSESKDDFDGYRKWLNIRGRRRPPSHYELLGIRLDENDQEVIQSAIDQRRSFIDSKRGEGHDDLVAEILMRLDEAQVTLFSHEMRRDYDKRLKLFKKRRLLRRLEFDWLPDPYRTQLQRAVGEEPEIVKTFAGIMAVLTVCFAAMAWFSFRLPWNGATEEPPMSVAVVEENKPPVPIPQPQVAAPAKVDDSPKQEDPKPAKSESSVAAKPSSTSLANLSSSSSKGEAPKPPQRRIIGAERVLRGHSAEIHFMTLSPDGQLIASAANDRSVRLWDLKSGRQIWSAACGKSDFKALDFHSSNKQIFVADSSAAYKIDVATGESKEVVKFTATGQACFGNNCSVIAHESKGTLTIHDTGKGKELAKSKDYIPAMSFDRDARLLVIGGWEGSGVVRARRLRDKKSVGEFRGLRDRTMAVQLSPDERLVAASSGCAKPEQNPAQNKVMVWDTSTGNPVLERTFEEGWCYAIAFSPDSKLLAAGGAASTSDWGGYSSPDKNLVRIWNIGGGAERCTLSGHRASV